MKKLSKRKQASPINFPKSSKPNTLRKSKKKFPFKIGKSKNKSTLRKGQRKIAFKSGKSLILILSLVSFIALAFISTKYILSLRENAFGQKNYIINDVIGLKDIPQYPGSEFIFANTQDTLVVKQFLAQGNSVYRLPKNIDTQDVEKYYLEQLPNKGWELVNTVVIGTEDKKYGQYWVKEGKGLRIYIKFKDAWYETLTEKDSREALAQRVKEEIEREMLMASSEKQDLLPDYPWEIQIPKEYIIRYSASKFKDYRVATFQKIGTNEIIELYPAGYWKGKELDYILDDYCKYISEDENTWEVVSTTVATFRGELSLNGSITSDKGTSIVKVIPNAYNNVVYVMKTDKQADPLYEYLFENIKPLGSD